MAHSFCKPRNRVALLLVGILMVATFISKGQCLPTIELPSPRYESDVSVEEALHKRRSVRDFAQKPLTLGEVSQLLWSAQGITDREGLRTAPSAGALYPLEVFIVVGNVEDLPEGVYRYISPKHELRRMGEKDQRKALGRAALWQSCIADGAAVIVFAAVYERTTRKYGQRGVRYVHLEAGHAAQNVYLQAQSLDLATVVVGAFKDDKVRDVLGLSEEEQPLYLMPVGRPE